MIPEIINVLKDRLINQQFIAQCYGLGTLYTVNSQKQPVVFDADEPLLVNFDNYTSLTFWLLNGPVTQIQADSDVSCGAWVQKRAPLKLIYFSTGNRKKICLPIDEDALANIISVLVFQDDKELRDSFQLAGISLSATSQEFRREILWNYLFGSLPFKMEEHQQLFSIDFDLVFEGNPACWATPCAAVLLDTTQPPQDFVTEDDENLFM